MPNIAIVDDTSNATVGFSEDASEIERLMYEVLPACVNVPREVRLRIVAENLLRDLRRLQQAQPK